MIHDNYEREVETMSRIKPIQATPTLSGIDAERLIADVNRKPTKEAIERNKWLQEVLRKVKKQ